jgi:DNA modification methylase
MPKSHIDSGAHLDILGAQRMKNCDPAVTRELVDDFNAALGTNWHPPKEIRESAERLLAQLDRTEMKSARDRKQALIALTNWKFRFNSEGISNFLDRCAELRLFFNYHDKHRIQGFFDRSDTDGFREWVSGKKLHNHSDYLRSLFQPLPPADTLNRLAHELSDPENRSAILCSLFGGYVYHSFNEHRLHGYFNDDCRLHYHEDFLEHLRCFYPVTTTRNCALITMVIDNELVASVSDFPALKDLVYSAIENAYERLSNYCCLGVLLRPITICARQGDRQWELFSDIVLFAEKFREAHLKTGYFHPVKIQQATTDHIPDIDLEKAAFAIANEGFYFKDCFVLCREKTEVEASSQPCDLLLLFEKNERDETLVPCPACRSKDVRGNSYPVLGVRSWECQNSLCPERSKYNRGNRYSLQSLLRQEAIEAPENRIPPESLKRWKRDIVFGVSDAELLEMLVRHYTFHGDTILLWDWRHAPRNCAGRKIIVEDLLAIRPKSGRADKFFDSAFFHRFRLRRGRRHAEQAANDVSTLAGVRVLHGDAYEVLQSIPDESVDGAVTSPPYYNAKSYASWPNIYCYLHDMFNVACEIHRVLKTGAPFLFNIFDYFDNENSIVFSAMGKKRMILGAYTIHLFRAAGFTFHGNVVWDKGEIEGKRNFNQGNHSPYYQAPFNCWEHIFVFSKGKLPTGMAAFPSVLRLRPVFKMVNGENVLGHSAPFPKEIPELLLGRLDEGGTVLDPFSGSMTTGRAAYTKGFRSINIECHREYCDLGLRLLERETQQMDMFKALALAERYSEEPQLPEVRQSRKVSYTKHRPHRLAKAGATTKNGHA